MSTPDVIRQQEALLQTHRDTLAHYLKQQAALGSAHSPPGITHGIREARAAIASIKTTLRGWGVTVEDLPGDVESVSEGGSSNTAEHHVTTIQTNIGSIGNVGSSIAIGSNIQQGTDKK